jgi:predicted regulator of Ras-like GTPase activity (Roadblock/LC7/MglB family)
VQNPIQTKFREVVAKLREAVTNVQAVILVGPEGVIDHMLDDKSLNLETIAGEYATLLHIARSASEDSGSGNLVENIVVSEKSIMIARTISPEHYLILLARSQDQIGRARYELKQAAWEIQAKRQPGRAQPQ